MSSPNSEIDVDALRSAFLAHAEGQSHFTRRMAITIADMFGAQPMRVVWRLEKLGLLKAGSWNWFRDNGGITEDHVREAREHRRITPPAPRPNDE